MTQPAAESYPWLPLADVLDSLGVGAHDPAAGRVDRNRQAAAAYVQRVRPDLLTAAGAVETFAADAAIVEGAMLLTARLHARKGSPLGLASFGEFGAAAVARLDVDIERLLGLGRHARPVIG